MAQIRKIYHSKGLRNFTDEELAVIARDDMKASLTNLKAAWYSFLEDLGCIYHSDDAMTCFDTKTTPFVSSVDEVPLDDWIDEVIEKIDQMDSEISQDLKSSIRSKLAPLKGIDSNDD